MMGWLVTSNPVEALVNALAIGFWPFFIMRMILVFRGGDRMLMKLLNVICDILLISANAIIFFQDLHTHHWALGVLNLFCVILFSFDLWREIKDWWKRKGKRAMAQFGHKSQAAIDGLVEKMKESKAPAPI